MARLRDGEMSQASAWSIAGVALLLAFVALRSYLEGAWFVIALVVAVVGAGYCGVRAVNAWRSTRSGARWERCRQDDCAASHGQEASVHAQMDKSDDLTAGLLGLPSGDWPVVRSSRVKARIQLVSGVGSGALLRDQLISDDLGRPALPCSPDTSSSRPSSARCASGVRMSNREIVKSWKRRTA